MSKDSPQPEKSNKKFRPSLSFPATPESEESESIWENRKHAMMRLLDNKDFKIFVDEMIKPSKAEALEKFVSGDADPDQVRVFVQTMDQIIKFDELIPDVVRK